MIHKQIAARQPGTDLASTQLRRLAALLAIVLVTTVLLSAAPVYAEPTITTPAPNLILVSVGSDGNIKNGNLKLAFKDEDILAYDPQTDSWTTYFDGSNHGIGGADLEDFEVLADGDLLFTLDKSFNIPQCAGGSLSVTDRDIVLFDSDTDCYSIYLSGAAIGLTQGDEDIDALACTTADCTTVLISTIGTASYTGGPSGVLDEDLVACTVPAGPCSVFFDGSDIDLTNGDEDVNGAFLNENDTPDSLWLTTKGKFNAVSPGFNSLGGDSNDVFGCAPGSFGTSTSCFLYEVFNGEAEGLKKNIDGLWATFAVTPPPLPLATTVVAADSQAEDAVEAVEAIDAADFAEAMSLGDPEVDAHDFMEVVQQFYLPLVNR